MTYQRQEDRLSYSAWKMYKTCPQKYNWRYIHKKPILSEESRHNALVGTVLAEVMEVFYNQELWRLRGKTKERIQDLAGQYYAEFLANNHINWNDFTCRDTAEDLRDACIKGAADMLTGIKDHKLLGPYARSEVNLDVQLKSGIILVGKADLVLEQSDKTLCLVDGKASKHRDKNVDINQLIWYALLYFLRYKRVPDRLGFFYFRFADDKEQSMDWLPLSQEDLFQHMQALKADILESFDAIKAEAFAATPSPSNCRYCPWEKICQDRIDQKEGKRKPKPPTIENSASVGVVGF